MKHFTSAKTRQRATNFRHNPSDAENLLWAKLKNRQLEGIKFRRQHPVGAFIVDFVSLEEKVVIEVDGSQHMENSEYDTRRTDWLESEGYRVLRFWDNDVLTNIEGVYWRIMESLAGKAVHPDK